MKKIKTYIPLITPFDKNLNIDYFSLEKIYFHIINLEYINGIILFDSFSEYKTINLNDKIDIINCILNNNKFNLNIILKINNLYNYYDLVFEINQKIYKNIYYIILDYPKFYNTKYQKDIIKNYNKLFKNYKYLFFYFTIKNRTNINENFILNIKENNKNFLGIINKTNYIFKNYELIKNLDIIIYNDLLLFNNIFLNINGIISPLFLLFFNYLYNDIILNINNNKFFLFNKTFYNLIKFIKILYKKIYPISGIKFLLNHLNLCNLDIKYPISNFQNINEYNQLITLFNKIINK
ncbi:MAG: hypothetical protein NHF90_00715 [Candidatus Shikimatogenerans sp. JK-2022]|nr:hypothetical protein [Candidatus Shikimatogenerans bostrichidophilus]